MSPGPAILSSKPGEDASLTGAFTLVTQSSAPGNILLTPQQMAASGARGASWQYAHLIGTPIPSRSTYVDIIVCFGGNGAGFEIPHRLLPKIGLQLILDWESIRTSIGGSISVYVPDGADVSQALVKLHSFAA